MPTLLPPGAKDLIKLLSRDELGPKAIKKAGTIKFRSFSTLY
jgi:hypothetical protein